MSNDHWLISIAADKLLEALRVINVSIVHIGYNNQYQVARCSSDTAGFARTSGNDHSSLPDVGVQLTEIQTGMHCTWMGGT
jgi:hypothetical protein